MIASREIIFGLVAGAILMLFGFYPPPLHRFMEDDRRPRDLLRAGGDQEENRR